MAKQGFHQVTYRWIEDLMASLEAHVDPETRVAVMEGCGRGCARATALPAAAKNRGDLDGWLKTLARWIGPANVQAAADLGRAEITYPRCLCHLVRQGPARLPDAYCDCSRGWLKELFETVLERPVEVTLWESIKRGGEACRFTVTW
jgi:hypothetical protein